MRVGGMLEIVRNLPGQRRAHYRPRSDANAGRDARVRATIRHAAHHVPHYRDLFASMGIEPAEIRSAEDLDLLPQLDRSAVQALGQRLLSDTAAGREAIPFRTTGSTAMPLTVYHDRSSLLANVAYSERERAVEARFAGRRYRYTVLDLRAAAGTLVRVREFYGRTSFRPLRPRHHLISVDTPVDRVLDALDELRPDVVHSYGGYLELLFRSAAASGRLRHPPKVAVYAGDTMNSAARELIEHDFGVPVVGNYNAVEAFKIAFMCEQRAGFHVHEDLCHVRLVGPDGERIRPGERGEVTISNLVNRATVLLNYRLGDLARLVDGPCECGRTSPRLVELEGRVDEFLDLGDGFYVYPTQLWDAFRARPEILQYQLVQHAFDQFELRVVLADERGAVHAAEGAASELRETLRGASVEVTLHEELPIGAGGKVRHLVPLKAVPTHGSEPSSSG